MHSRIFQISKKPVTDYMSEDRYYDGFVGSIADYIDSLSEEDQMESIECLKAVLGDSVRIDIENKCMTIVSKKKYFERKYERFLNMAADVSKMSFEDFCSFNGDVKMYSLMYDFDDKYGYYIDDYDNGWRTIDSFMREVKNREKFYFGIVTDYHM